MRYDLHLVVSCRGSSIIEGRVRASIGRSGGTVEEVLRRHAEDGGVDLSLAIQILHLGDLGRILNAVESVRGAAVRRYDIHSLDASLQPRFE